MPQRPQKARGVGRPGSGRFLFQPSSSWTGGGSGGHTLAEGPAHRRRSTALPLRQGKPPRLLYPHCYNDDYVGLIWKMKAPASQVAGRIQQRKESAPSRAWAAGNALRSSSFLLHKTARPQLCKKNGMRAARRILMFLVATLKKQKAGPPEWRGG